MALTKKLQQKIVPFLKLLEGHTPANPILSSMIEKELELSGGRVRKIVNHLRSYGITVWSGTGKPKGYGFATNKAAVQEIRESLMSRIRGIRRAADGLEHPRYNWTYEELRLAGICP